jgi:predicted enzyme related to lactoylglutathione lyase
MKKRNPVVHFEMPANDRVRMAKFYSDVFGWKANILGEEMGNYVTVQTCDTDENGMIKAVGAINGGFYPVSNSTPPMAPSIVIAVDDIDSYVKLITDEGGKVLGEPVVIPGIGPFVSFIDTEGNRVSILQPLPMK